MKAVVVLLVGVVIGAGAIFAADRTGVIELSSSDTTATTEATTTTTEQESTTTTDPAVDPAVALWPEPGSDERFSSPEEVARDFAANFIGFEETVVGTFQAGDPSSGEVPVQPRANGPITRILVRQLVPGSWWATGAVTDDIRLDTPQPGALANSPVRLTGGARAFEGQVQVDIRADGASAPVGNGFVTGGGDEVRPFDGQVTFDEAAARPAGYGAIVLTELGGEEGNFVNKATVIRIRF
ncbi:MAG TPA: Gmad2 immunoglobulin-like domain-containing protein [Acidimicrobiales bacterium]|nr:Gmad2 immunoglobulin-like domain-containing protein [Acidimicrobiales bacterium]